MFLELYQSYEDSYASVYNCGDLLELKLLQYLAKINLLISFFRKLFAIRVKVHQFEIVIFTTQCGKVLLLRIAVKL